MFEILIITAARDRVDEAVRGALAHHPVSCDDFFCGSPEPRFAPFRYRLSQVLRRLSDRLDPLSSIRPTP